MNVFSYKRDINANNLFFGEHMLIGEFSTDFGTYEAQTEKTIQYIKDGYNIPFWNDDRLQNLENVLLNNFQRFAGKYLAVIKVGEYSCVCAVDEYFANATCYRLLLLTDRYVYPFDAEGTYPIQMIETKTDWKY